MTQAWRERLAEPGAAAYVRAVSANRSSRVGLAIINTILFALDIYVFIVIGAVIFSWLYAFNVVNTSNRFVGLLGEFFYKATEPLLRPIRRVLPDLGGIDISPIVLFIGIYFLRQVIVNVFAPAIL
ncbi:YggT family protein [Roseitalea porphyridii]|uniref:YggT family protein n=1 Tax=Roseitalea porphyridii TaxID=1852022 RepID=A0A4P6V4A3_9HYPH|nr:YggT family protein [Roseitalea porphyridii]